MVVYRFLATPRWLGYAALTVAAATVMVLLGFWQLDRYHQRASINARISAGTSTTPVQLSDLVGKPTGATGSVGPAPAGDIEWTRVRVTGHFDPSREILVRGRTVNGAVGFEVVTPLVLADGTAVLVDRGWVPPAEGGALAAPTVPAAPTGDTTVVGRLRPPESRGGRPQQVNGRSEIRRITPAAIAPALPYAIFDVYVSTDEPAAGLAAVPPEKENALQNAGYVLQWWLFAALTLYGFVYLARREANGPTTGDLLDDEDEEDQEMEDREEEDREREEEDREEEDREEEDREEEDREEENEQSAHRSPR
jgi:cytochrome oxidase assembly protein ShyY1